MIVFPDFHCDRTLQTLLKTFFDILRLQKGPEFLPASWPLFYITYLASIVATLLATAAIFPSENTRYDLTLLLTAIIPFYYIAVLNIRGYRERTQQVLTAVAGADLVLTLIYLVLFLFVQLISESTTALILTILLSYWSVPVQGNIISKAIECHWGVGILIALTLQIVLALTHVSLVDIT